MPEYLRKLLEWKRNFLKKQKEKNEKISREWQAKQRQKQDEEKALRAPPQNVRLEGRMLRWDAPATADKLRPRGYWVSERYRGEWTKHGDYIMPHRRSQMLFGEGPAYVETWYDQMALGEMYRSETVGNEKK